MKGHLYPGRTTTELRKIRKAVSIDCRLGKHADCKRPTEKCRCTCHLNVPGGGVL